MSYPKTYRMCRTECTADGSLLTATHVTTGRREVLAWNDTLGIDGNHEAVAALVLGRAPEFRAACDGGGFIYGVDPANDPR